MHGGLSSALTNTLAIVYDGSASRLDDSPPKNERGSPVIGLWPPPRILGALLIGD